MRGEIDLKETKLVCGPCCEFLKNKKARGNTLLLSRSKILPEEYVTLSVFVYLFSVLSICILNEKVGVT